MTIPKCQVHYSICQKNIVVVMIRATEMQLKIYYDFRCSNDREYHMKITSVLYVDIIIYCFLCVHYLIIK